MEELLEPVFSVQSVPTLYNEGQLPLGGSFEITEEQEVGARCPPAWESVRGVEWSELRGLLLFSPCELLLLEAVAEAQG
jgi:hypothetical protein